MDKGATMPDFDLRLRRSRQARRLSLRVSQIDGRVTLTMPAAARETEALAFVRAHRDWIADALAGVPAPCAVSFGSELPIEGRTCLIVARPGAGPPRLDGERLLVCGDAGGAGRRVAGFLRALARQRLQAACSRHAGTLGKPYRKIRLADPRARWGSCSAQGDLMFSWRLIMAPPAVLDYVAAHEVAHLAEMNHAPAFWACLESLLPGHDGARRWLRRNGGSLHRFRFGT